MVVVSLILGIAAMTFASAAINDGVLDIASQRYRKISRPVIEIIAGAVLLLIGAALIGYSVPILFP